MTFTLLVRTSLLAEKFTPQRGLCRVWTPVMADCASRTLQLPICQNHAVKLRFAAF
ncbi:hypothetical protein [Limnohabitans sp. T6-5]|uniref:hypothetical protein n=1 Tax=Limnohabitans sp. T6-5 TaxID=1100724 RepID=UPI0013047EB5|nr:hypothetical protein [Limnohabitans sp. T6-5]